MTGQLATVDLRQGEYLVSTYSRTTSGFWVLDGTPTQLPPDTSPDQLGAAVRVALDQSRGDLVDPGRGGQPAQPLLDLLGLPDYAAYAKGTRSVEVYRDDESFEVTPKRNEGVRKGFTPIDEEAEVFTYESPAQLGTEVIKAFDKAT